MQIDKILNQLGFSGNESKVYLACLKAGINSAQAIAAIAGLQRTTTYSVLKQLVLRGVIGKSKVKGKSRFVAEPPHKLTLLLSEVQTNLSKALPELEAIYNKSEVKPRIIFYEGNTAIQKVYDDTLAEKPTEILEWNTNKYFQNMHVDRDYIKKRIALNIKAKRIAGSGSVWDSKHRHRDQQELSETIVVPRDVFWPDIEVNIYSNKIAFLNYAEKMSIIIESKAIAEAMKQVYQLSWRGAATLARK